MFLVQSVKSSCLRVRTQFRLSQEENANKRSARRSEELKNQIKGEGKSDDKLTMVSWYGEYVRMRLEQFLSFFSSKIFLFHPVFHYFPPFHRLLQHVHVINT